MTADDSVAAADRRSASAALLQVVGLTKDFAVGPSRKRDTRFLRAVDDVSVTLGETETLALVGESGCGKSTTGRLIARLIKPTAGTILIDGVDVTALEGKELQPFRRTLSMVFQDPQASLDPRMSVGRTIAEPLRIHGTERAGRAMRVAELLDQVGLPAHHARRYPHELSGGQRQRVGIARALALNPRIVVLDEPVSALDVSIQAQILGLLEDLQEQHGLAYVFISHDLSVVGLVADRVAVMYLGRLVEFGQREDVLGRPRHPYTTALLSSVPLTDPSERGQKERIILKGDLPSPLNPPSGCVFRTRCWKAQEVCATERPLLREVDPGRTVACHFPEGVPAASLDAAIPDLPTATLAPHTRSPA